MSRHVAKSILKRIESVKKVIVCPFSDKVDSNFKKFTLPELEYDFDALEPFISADIMKIHYEKHHATYVNNLNIAKEKSLESLEKNNIVSFISLQKAIKFNGGGHINHSLFWKCLCPSSTSPTGHLNNDINARWGDFESFCNEFCSKAAAVQGSGWCWLVQCPNAKTLHIVTTANQDPVQATTGLIPLMGVDVWEHAYYLQYQNRRPDYVKAIFNVINWKYISAKYENIVSESRDK